jgi:SAM-dependent methyltransferase
MTSQVLRHDKQCRVCGDSSVVSLFRLRDTPLEDQFISIEHKTVEQPVYPLELAMCEKCGYVHLPYVVNPEVSYIDYVYVSGVTVGLRNHYDEYAEKIIADYEVPGASLVVDLGSNDGSMLASFKRLGMRVVGVEPAKAIAQRADANGLPTINGFFTAEVVSQILEGHGPAGVVSANYMYANVDDIIGFTENVAKLLGPEGVFVVQTGYHPEQMKIKMFDYIYHEHFSYFTVEVLKSIFSACGLELIQAEKTEPKGGSIRAIGQLLNGSREVGESVEHLVREERSQGMKDSETYQRFATEIEHAKTEILTVLLDIKAAGKRIVGFGASHSTTTLTYHFELAQYIEYLADDNVLKHGSFSPGYHLPVRSTAALIEDAPDYVIILAWQHQRSIIERHRLFLETGGKFIVPLPSLKIVDAENVDG